MSFEVLKLFFYFLVFAVAIGNSISESDLLKPQTKKFFKSSVGAEPRTLACVKHTVHH